METAQGEASEPGQVSNLPSNPPAVQPAEPELTPQQRRTAIRKSLQMPDLCYPDSDTRIEIVAQLQTLNAGLVELTAAIHQHNQLCHPGERQSQQGEE